MVSSSKYSYALFHEARRAMAAKLVVLFGETPRKTYSLDVRKSYVIGRWQKCDIVILHDTKVSRRHCILKADSEGHWILTDQGSSNGTVVNHQPIVFQRLEDGDAVRVGRAVFEFQK
jgi:pSer/pThr/pTyr-binding forkhead associated (FHA) protein